MTSKANSAKFRTPNYEIVLEYAVDKNTRTRILEVSKFEEEDRDHIFSVIDAFIAKRKIQSIL